MEIRRNDSTIHSHYYTGWSRELIEKPAQVIPGLELGLHNYIQSEPTYDKMRQNDGTKSLKISILGHFGGNHVTPRGLSQNLVTQMVCVEGVVTSVSNNQSRLVQSIYYCEDPQNTDIPSVRMRIHRDNTSLLWQDIQVDSVGLKEDENGNTWEEEFGFCRYKDQQRLVIQEAPENAPTGQIPTSVVALIEEDLVDTVKPGDRVRIVGVYKAFPKVQNGVTNAIFNMRVICNSVKKMREDILKSTLLMSETKMIRNISKRKDVFDLLARSFAPSIAGNLDVKKGLLLLMVGGIAT